MRLASLAVVAAILAGPGCFGMCGLSPSEATWTDPALFVAMPPPGTAGATWTPPGPGLPFTRVIDAGWGPHNLTLVQRASGDPGDGSDVYVGIAVESGLTAARENTTPERDVAQAVHAFLANATTLGAPARAAYVEALMGNASAGPDSYYGGDAESIVTRHTVTYTAPLPHGLRLDELYGDLERVGATQVALGGASAGPWTFAFSMEQRALEADGGRLQVGPTGDARFEGLGEGERPAAAYRKDVHAWLAAHGLPVPGDMHVGGSIC